MNGNQLENSEILSRVSTRHSFRIKTYNNNKILEFELEAFIGEREFPIYITKKSKIEINILEDKNYLWGFLPEEKMVDFKGYSNYKNNNINLGCLLVRISSSHDFFQVDHHKFKFSSQEQGSLMMSANLDFDNCLFYEPKGSLKLIIKGGELCDMNIIDELTDYNSKMGNIKNTDETAYSEMNVSILRYINKARSNIEKYINDFILEYDLSEEEEVDSLLKNKKLSPYEIDVKLYKIAEEHCKDIGSNGTSGHIGTDGSTFKERLEKHKIKSKECEESIIYGYNNPISIVNFLVIDKYSKNCRERKNLLNNKYKKIGISLHKHLCYGYCCVIVFSE
jgi:hypothetical protein